MKSQRLKTLFWSMIFLLVTSLRSEPTVGQEGMDLCNLKRYLLADRDECEVRLVDNVLEICVNAKRKDVRFPDKGTPTAYADEMDGILLCPGDSKYQKPARRVILRHMGKRRITWKIARSRLGDGFEYCVFIESRGAPEIISHFFGDTEDFIINHRRLMWYIPADILEQIRRKMELLE